MILLWLACGGTECSDEQPCAFGGSCEDGVCVFRRCATSLQCALEQHCTEDGVCAPGCVDDGDCALGEACGGDGTCAARACTDTQVDCAFREFCEDGDCVDAGDPHCLPCTTDAECGEGNVCWGDLYCAVDCSGGQPCPAGFACEPLEQEGTDWVVCLGACWLSPS